MVAENVSGFTVTTLAGGLAETDDGGEIGAEGGGDFSADVFLGLAEKQATFGMADEDIINDRAELGDGGLTGKGTIIVGTDVLGTEF